MTVDEVKTLLRIPPEDSSKDDYLAVMIPLLVDYVKKYCNQDFTDELPGGVKLAIAKMAEFNLANVAEQSVAVGAYSVTYATGAEYPRSILNLLRPYRRVVFV